MERHRAGLILEWSLASSSVSKGMWGDMCGIVTLLEHEDNEMDAPHEVVGPKANRFAGLGEQAPQMP